MWMSLALLGCGQPSVREGQEEPVSGDVDLEVSPEDGLDFGSVPLGESAEQTLTIHNAGTSDVMVAEIRLSNPDTLAVHGFQSSKIRAGNGTEITVEWTPSETGDLLDDSLDLRVGVQLADLSDVDVPLSGTVSGPHLSLSESNVDLGTVLVGCAKTFKAVATNVGNEALEISAITLTDDREFALQDGAGAPVKLPIQLEPGESTDLDVVYTPMDEHDVSTTLQIESNDALAATTNLRVDATGKIDASNTMTWTVTGPQAVAVIINVNQWTLQSNFSDDMDDFLPELFKELRGAGVSFRFGIVMSEEGSVSGDIPYIDESFSVDDAVDAANDMLDGSSMWGDNDTNLDTLLNALDADENAWLWEDDFWTESRVNLMSINNDTEQSPGNAEHYVESYQDYKNEADGTGDVVVHGIAGPAGGCHVGDEYAENAQNLRDAIDLTDGVFIEICDDWNKSIPDLIDAFTGTIETFELTGNPAPWSIEVRVDGAQLFTGWTYDEKTQQIVFDDATYPARGSTLRIDYLMAVTCKE
jgi:hypothetical protein